MEVGGVEVAPGQRRARVRVLITRGGGGGVLAAGLRGARGRGRGRWATCIDGLAHQRPVFYFSYFLFFLYDV